MDTLGWENLNRIAIIISLVEGTVLVSQAIIWIGKHRENIGFVARQLLQWIVLFLITSSPMSILALIIGLFDSPFYWQSVLTGVMTMLIFVIPGALPAILLSNYEKAAFRTFWFSFGMGVLASIYFWLYITDMNLLLKILFCFAFIGAFLIFGLLHAEFAWKLKQIFVKRDWFQP